MKGAIIGTATALALVAAACGSGAGVPEPADGGGGTATPTETPRAIAPTATPAPPLPPLDESQHTVPLEEIFFDTFGLGGPVRLTEASDQLIANLRDAIPPIYEPVYEPAAGGDWLESGDLIVGLVDSTGQAYAYPHKILNFPHEIVNDELDGVPVLVSFCPLCGSAVVFDRRIDGQPLTFGNTSALYNSDMVMFDWETNSYWWQVPGEAIVGSLAGQTLPLLPSTTTTWEAWRDIHPSTLVLSRETGFARPYERDPFVGFEFQLNTGEFAFPVGDEANDPRLLPGQRVLAVEIDNERRVYPPLALGDAAVNDTLGGEPIVILSKRFGSVAAAYSALVDGAPLTFSYAEGEYRDTETGSVWDFGGRAIGGPLAGTTLTSVPTRTTFWYAYVAAFPDTPIYEPIDAP